jgi:hypothetical protein
MIEFQFPTQTTYLAIFVLLEVACLFLLILLVYKIVDGFDDLMKERPNSGRGIRRIRRKEQSVGRGECWWQKCRKLMTTAGNRQRPQKSGKFEGIAYLNYLHFQLIHLQKCWKMNYWTVNTKNRLQKSNNFSCPLPSPPPSWFTSQRRPSAAFCGSRHCHRRRRPLQSGDHSPLQLLFIAQQIQAGWQKL